ncbi:predicted protein [Nematostella vectensis]|uniref:Gamma tubulin complex component C-terminal domain-containing protein n=1 Tax=Nematostella vectensis TaxID=45351 RepID=A7SRN8_NEMVE|nr:predicted protein [Nematostella vectensis]|eukprot:XP_001625728.1 predicted protein [Nematostella vectensis]
MEMRIEMGTRNAQLDVFARSHKDPFTLYVSDIREQMLFSITNINSDANGNYSGQLNAILSFGRTSILTSIAVTRDDDHILVGDCKENAPCVYVCYLVHKTITRTVSGVVAPTGIAVTEEGTVFVSSIIKKLFLLKFLDVVYTTGDTTQNVYKWNRKVLECCWADLKKRVTEASDLDHIIAAHETFLDQVISRSLLDTESKEVVLPSRKDGLAPRLDEHVKSIADHVICLDGLVPRLDEHVISIADHVICLDGLVRRLFEHVISLADHVLSLDGFAPRLVKHVKSIADHVICLDGLVPRLDEHVISIADHVICLDGLVPRLDEHVISLADHVLSLDGLAPRLVKHVKSIADHVICLDGLVPRLDEHVISIADHVICLDGLVPRLDEHVISLADHVLSLDGLAPRLDEHVIYLSVHVLCLDRLLSRPIGHVRSLDNHELCVYIE